DFAIVRHGVGSVIPFGNHDRQSRTNRCNHGGPCVGDMRCPVINVRDADTLSPGVITCIFVPAYFIGTGMSILQKSCEIGPIILVINRAYELPMKGDALQLGYDSIPGI